MRSRHYFVGLAVGFAVVLAAQAAWGAPDLSGTVIIDEPNGSFNLCDAPCYRVEKAVEVFLNGNPTGMDCQAWISSDEIDMGSAGLANAGSAGGAGQWNSGLMLGCDQTAAGCAMGRAHVYCFAK